MKFKSNQPPAAGFQLAPMIDVVFLLLIFFIVTYQLSDYEKELEVNVPTAEEGSTESRGYLEVVVNVRKDGDIIIEKENYTIDELQKKMENLARVNKDQPIRIRGDAETHYQDIVTVIDRCRKAGIWNISFATQSPKPKG
ncbi:biopolymer transport protein ExbD [Rubritalea squalenifaciens DSM 18772]|uniref:Biopolymer transport protein ExbD n=2 Tax=Rubritalea TaxID=361050 RepID=A0A1M6ETI5_9BACT|nr:biopolymer transporter ExbD [Rubritalea squalenifaciens]SHI88680.1 biopolymer transport protein ExbD [Rubritalea squalenifaciens DSM 18772]